MTFMSNYSKNKKVEKAFNGENMYIQTSFGEEVNPESLQHTHTHTQNNPHSMQGVMSLRRGTYSESELDKANRHEIELNIYSYT
jgi:hypothetical protein